MIIFFLATLVVVVLYVLFTLLVNLSFLVSLLPVKWSKEPKYVGITGVITVAALAITGWYFINGKLEIFSKEVCLGYGLFTGFAMWHILNRRKKEKQRGGEKMRSIGGSILLLVVCMIVATGVTFGLIELFGLSVGLSFPFD